MANLRISIFFFLSFCKSALSFAKNRVNPIDKAQEHSMSIRANCLTWRECQMRLIQYQGMVHSRNDGTSFNVLGMGGCFTSTFACTPNFSQIESNVLPIILIQSSKAELQIFVTLSGITTDCKPTQFLNAPSPTSVAPSGITPFPSITLYSISRPIIVRP